MRHKLRWSVLILLIATTVSASDFSPFLPSSGNSPVSTSSNLTLDFAGAALLGGMIVAVVENDIAYCAMRCGLLTLDVSDPTKPEFISELYVPGGYCTDLKVRGNLVYLTGWNGALSVVDVSNPEIPALAGSYITPAAAYGLDVVGDLAYVVYGSTTDSCGLLILDISNSSNIIRISNVPSIDATLKVKVNGKYAYVVGGGYVWIVDVTDPTQPDPVIEFYTGFYPVDLDVVDSVVYLADYDPMWPAGGSAFTILNISDPENPIIMGRHFLRHGVGDVTVSGEIAYVANDRWGVQIFDISDPSNPDSISNYPVAGYTGKVAYDDSLIYIVDYGHLENRVPPGDFEIADVSDPLSPKQLGLYSQESDVINVVKHDHYVYALHDEPGHKVTIVDISTSAVPVGTYETAGRPTAGVSVGDYLYLGTTAGLEIVGVSDPLHPVSIGFDPEPTGILDVIIIGNYAYLANASAGLRIVDVTDKTNPRHVMNIALPGRARSVVHFGNYVYVATPFAEPPIHICDISEPENSHYVKSVGEGFCNKLAISQYLFAKTPNGFRVYGLSDPENPALLGSHWDGIWNYDIAALSDLVYVADGWDGVKIVDVSDPSSPYLAGGYNTSGFARALFVDDTNVCVADTYCMISLKYPIPTSVDDDQLSLPETFVLYQNYPNPFNPTTTIEFDLPRRSDITLSVYNILGQLTYQLTNRRAAGHHALHIDMDGRASGVYFYKLEYGDFSQTKKMILLK